METTVSCALCNFLGSNDENFLQNTDEAKKNHARIHFFQSKNLDDGIREDEILQRCFMKVARPASTGECRQALLDLCKSLVKRHPKGHTAACNMCGFKITGATNVTNRHMVNHASAHLEEKVFKCRHCVRSSSSLSNIRCHILQAHKVEPTNKDFENKTVERFDDISKRIKRCFSTNFPRASGSHRQFLSRQSLRNKTHRSITDLCRSIFIQRSKPASLECDLCGSRIRCGGIIYQPNAMHQHAAAHLENKLFKCLHCEQSLSSKSAIRQHLRVFHQIIDGNTDDFDDQSERFHSEHLSMIERCFSADHVKLEVSSTTRSKCLIKSEANIRSLTIGSELLVERHLFCYRMIGKIVSSDGKVQCSWCSKRLAVKFSGGVIVKNAVSHAEKHLQKPLYRCKVCEKSFRTHKAIAGHLRSKHALGLERNHECIADEFHLEIMDMMSKCYTSDG